MPAEREVWVECYSGHTYAQEPLAFFLGGERIEVERVIARWRTPAGPAFRVRSGLGEHILRYDEAGGVWMLTEAYEAHAGDYL